MNLLSVKSLFVFTFPTKKNQAQKSQKMKNVKKSSLATIKSAKNSALPVLPMTKFFSQYPVSVFCTCHFLSMSVFFALLKAFICFYICRFYRRPHRLDSFPTREHFFVVFLRKRPHVKNHNDSVIITPISIILMRSRDNPILSHLSSSMFW